MSKFFKILISLIVICLSCTALFACGSMSGDESASESQKQSTSESNAPSQSTEESEEVDTESNFNVELPEVDRM
ncbi:MAG: hypothetical protein IKA99_00545 [Clostridia bacterium]|nr:hypothetical protein [Clostridia bacterium]